MFCSSRMFLGCRLVLPYSSSRWRSSWFSAASVEDRADYDLAGAWCLSSGVCVVNLGLDSTPTPCNESLLGLAFIAPQKSMKGVFMAAPSPYDLSSSACSQSSVMVGDGGEQTGSLPLIAASMEVINDKQIIRPPRKPPEYDFAATPCVPVYVMLPSYDQNILQRLRKATEMKGHSFWTRMPDNAGSCNSQPHETGFFCDGGDYDGYYGRFFINWYSAVLVDHGDRVLSLAKLPFSGTCIAEKRLPGIHWWYKTASHAAKLTAGFYNPHKQDGYTAIAAMLEERGAALNFACAEVQFVEQHEELRVALIDPQGLVWQVLKAAWENALFYLKVQLTCH
ncbi:hypothetical protein PTKIN_Ptkin12aG0182700 [Pterospermum kingtungense]